MAFPERAEQMVLLLERARDLDARPLVIGNGTNLLIPDEGLDRLVIVAAGLRKLEAGSEPHTILAEAGATLAQAAAWHRENEPRGEYVLVLAGAERRPENAVTLAQGV